MTRRSIGLLVLVAMGCATPPASERPVMTTVTQVLPEGAEAWSLFGEPLAPPPLPPDTRARFEAQLAEAQSDFDRNPQSVDAAIWLGRRTAYLGRYRDAIRIYSDAIARHPGDARLYRHRGHRFITVRQFDDAVADLTYAADLISGSPDQVEPDGLPNARNIPTSTLQTNIWYHLGLAHYLNGDYEEASRAYYAALALSANADMRVATTHWLYMTLRRLRRPVDAQALLGSIQREMDIIENHDYYRLLLMYKGMLSPEELLHAAEASPDGAIEPTLGYGLANWFQYNGDRRRAAELYRRILSGEQWAAFGFIASEVDLRRLGGAPPARVPAVTRSPARSPHRVAG